MRRAIRSTGSMVIPPNAISSTSRRSNLSHEQLQQLSDEVGPERTLLVLCTAFRGKAERYSEPDREEDSQSGAHPLRMGPRRLQPQGREPAQGPTANRDSRRSFDERGGGQ